MVFEGVRDFGQPQSGQHRCNAAGAHCRSCHARIESVFREPRLA